METVTPSPKTKKKKRSASLSLTVAKKKYKKSALSSKSVPPSQLNYQLIEHSGNNSEEVGSEVLEGSTPSKTNISFEEIKTFEDFHIKVKGKCIDCELPDDVRSGYYKLCLCRNQFLHEGIPESLYCKLVAGMIGETVSIANEIQNCKITTTKEEFETWDNSLKSFELLGMKVGFLRDRIHKLETIVFESEGALDIKKYVEAVNKHKRAEDEIKKVAAKLKELKGTAKKYECVSGCLKQKADEYENKFKEEVDAPW